jgi:hypothetical protein
MKTTARYVPVVGSQLTKDEAKRYGPALEKVIHQHGGSATPAQVLKEARNRNSPLHSWFEWNDRVAGEAYRLAQASKLLRSIVIIPVIQGKPTSASRAFLNVKVDSDDVTRRSYVPAERVRKDARLRAQMVERALKELESWVDRYRRYDDLDGLCAAIQKELVRLRKGGKAA